MSNQPPEARPAPEVVASATAVLGAALGGTVRLGDAEKLRGNKRASVFRIIVLDGPDGAPSSVVIKHINTTPEYSSGPQAQMPSWASTPALSIWTFFNDWASLQFLDSLANDLAMPCLAPRFYGGDRAMGLVVMEDLGTGMRLDHYLLGADANAAEAALAEYAAVHGRLHGLTRRRHADYAAIREALGPAHHPMGHYSFGWLAATLAETVDALGITLTSSAEADLAALAAALRNPGPFFTFTQGDACPDNCIRVDGSLHLVDFEDGRFGHALTEGIYGRMQFPTCWCVGQMPERVARRMEAAYRAELMRWVAEAADDRLFYHALTEACAYWMLDWFHELPLRDQLERDHTWGMASVWQRTLARLEIAARATQEYGHLTALGETLAAVQHNLEALWPADVHHMPPYPAFDGLAWAT